MFVYPPHGSLPLLTSVLQNFFSASLPTSGPRHNPVLAHSSDLRCPPVPVTSNQLNLPQMDYNRIKEVLEVLFCTVFFMVSAIHSLPTTHTPTFCPPLHQLAVEFPSDWLQHCVVPWEVGSSSRPYVSGRCLWTLGGLHRLVYDCPLMRQAADCV